MIKIRNSQQRNSLVSKYFPYKFSHVYFTEIELILRLLLLGTSTAKVHAK